MARMTASRPTRDGRATATVLAMALAFAGLMLGARDRTLGQGDEPPAKDHASPARAALQRGRGRQADRPGQIPAGGWKDVLWRTWDQVQQDRVVSIAAGVTFYALLALFPAVAATVAIYGLVADPATIQSHFDQLQAFMPYGAADIVGEQLKAISAKADNTLGLAFAVGLAVSLWSANSGMKAIFDALNIAYGEEEKRSFLRLNAVSLLFTLGAIVTLLLGIAAIAVVPLVLSLFPLGELADPLLRYGRWVLLLAVIVVALAVLYRFGPSRNEPQWRWVSVGSVAAAVGWLVASAALSFYAQNFANYDKTYGSLGAAVGLMIWMWVSTIVVLIGAELNAEVEHQTLRDTTTGGGKPLGTRGAAMADTVGRSAG